jgi:uncharacterized protein (DUF2141 family)
MRRRFQVFVAAGLALLLGASAAAQADPACTGRESDTRLYVDVVNVRKTEGLIAVTLYADDRSKFLARRGSLYVGRVPARTPATEVCIFVPRPGTYALAVYHDADADRSFDRTGIGLPKEGYGFSNNPPVIFGLPSFSKVRLAVPRSDLRTSVRLRYP